MAALVLPYGSNTPRLGPGVFLAPTSVLIGNVELGARASVWYGSVLRGDVHSIRIGADANVQDGAVLHGTQGEWPVLVGERVSIGHHATVHGAVLEDDVLIGIGARVLEGARVGSWSLVAAGAVVREGTVVPPRSLVAGVPAVVKRPLTEREVEVIRRTPGRYLALAAEHRRALEAARS
jgi:carbonic anhydrase/acetyltransferase-like protein (isoleucine patch superfamily)